VKDSLSWSDIDLDELLMDDTDWPWRPLWLW